MHLKIQKRNERDYLSVVQNYRQGGKTKTRTVETIGYADAFADRYEDPIAHFKSYVAELNSQSAAERRPIELSFGIDDAIAASAEPPARLGAAIALGCLDAIGVRGFFQARSGHAGFTAHAGRIFEMLAAERMMHATSKRESWTARASFPRPCNFSYKDVYEALPCFARESEHLEASLQRQWKRVYEKPAGETIFVPCGTYAFPNAGAGERASVAVALDARGMPLGYRAFMGRLNPTIAGKAVDDLKDQADAQRAIVITAALRDPEPSMAKLAANGDGFVIFQPNLATSPDLASWVQDESDYETAGADVRMKRRTVLRSLPGVGEVPVSEVVLAGGGYALQQGRALLVTSETDLPTTQIVQLFRELWRQAEPFQPLEADFSAMPVPVSAYDHITAHFALCYAAFFALRALRWKAGWQHNAADTADALLRMEGIHLQQNYYLFNHRSATTDDIENAVGIPPARRLRTRLELRSIPTMVCQSFYRESDGAS